jgi:5-methylcytosine-specific restriction enzyme A
MPRMPSEFRTATQEAEAIESRRVREVQRGTARERGYDARWDRASVAFRWAHPLCVGCLALGRVVPADVTDHIEPHRGNKTLFWNRANWQAACSWHHDVVKKRLEQRFDANELAAADLRLDSEWAKATTIELEGVGGGLKV